MIALQPMNNDDFMALMRKSVPEYAFDQMRAGNWAATEAVGRARAEFQQMLPDGPVTPNQQLRVILNDGQKIGMLWYFVDASYKPPKVFLLDFFLFSEARQKSFEAEALAAFESEAAGLGASRVELQVFIHREEDVALYLKNGYAQVSIFLAKNIVPG